MSKISMRKQSVRSMVTFRLFLFLVGASTLFAENPYQVISERNAFDLTTTASLPPPPPTQFAPLPSAEVYLTGITRHGQARAHLVLKEKGSIKNKFLSLSEGQKQDNITVIKILKKSVLIDSKGTKQHLSFKTHGLPTVILKAPTVKTSSRASSTRSKSFDKTSLIPSTPRPQIVTVPSRRPRIDPRIIEKGLEYLNKTEERKKRK